MEILPDTAKMFDLGNEIVSKLNRDLIKKIETQILNALKKNGFDFERGENLNHFMETRCERQIIGNLNRLLVDGIVLCEWDDNINIKVEGNTVIATYG